MNNSIRSLTSSSTTKETLRGARIEKMAPMPFVKPIIVLAWFGDRSMWDSWNSSIHLIRNHCKKLIVEHRQAAVLCKKRLRKDYVDEDLNKIVRYNTYRLTVLLLRCVLRVRFPREKKKCMTFCIYIYLFRVWLFMYAK